MQKRALGRIATHPVMQQKVEEWRNCHDDWKSLAAFMLSKNTGRRFKKKSTQNRDSVTRKILEKKLPKPVPGQEVQNKCQKTSKKYPGVSPLTSTDKKIPNETVNSCSDQSDEDTDGKMKLSGFIGSEEKSVENSVERPIENSSLNRIIHENANEIKEETNRIIHENANEIKEKANMIIHQNANKIKEKTVDTNTESIPSINKEMVVKKLCLDDLTSDKDIVITGNPHDKSISFLFESEFQRKKMKKDTFFMDSGSEVESSCDDSGDEDFILDVRNQEEGNFYLENKGRI